MSAGYQPPRYPEVRDDVEQKWKRTWGDNANTAPDQLDGLIIDIWSVFVSVLYEALSELVAQHFYSTAEGGNLDMLLAIFGSQRQDAANSSVEVVVYGDDLTTVDQGSLVSTTDVGDAFVTDADVTILAGSLYAVFTLEPINEPANITITIGAEVTVIGFPFGATVENIHTNIPAALEPTSNVTQAWGLGVQPDGQAIVVVQMTGGFTTAIASDVGSTVADHIGALVSTTAEDTGRISGVAGTVTTVNSPIPGWEGVVNLVDATPGRDRSNDTQYRVIHERTLNNKAVATPRGVVDEILLLDGVVDARWFENLTTSTDAYGRPPGRWEIVVEGGDTQIIAETIWLNHTTGTGSWGLELVIVQDERGKIPVPREIRFTRPSKKYVHARIVLEKGERFPNLALFDIQTAVQQAVVAWGGNVTNPGEISMGDDVYNVELSGVVSSTIEGTRSITVELGTTPGPLDPTPGLSVVDIPVGERDWAQFDSTRIEVEVI